MVVRLDVRGEAMPFDSSAVLADIQFLRAWQEGCVQDLSAFLRIRQIYRANLLFAGPPAPQPEWQGAPPGGQGQAP